MKDDFNLKEYVVMRYHHMYEEGFYPEAAIDKLREKLQEELARKELTSQRINELFGVINTEFMKEFWGKRAKEHELNEALTNLEDDEELLKLKTRDEQKKLLPYTIWKDKDILDLGSGWGSWAFKFIREGAKSITCVDYIPEMCDKGKKIAREEKIKNIEFINKPVQTFSSIREFDIIFISGLSVHLNDDDYKAMLKNIERCSRIGTELILRDGTGVPVRHSFDKEWSERLKTHYSAIYRSREEYIEMFKKIGFALVSDENMFPEGHPLNKYPKTRLRLYKFTKADENWE